MGHRERSLDRPELEVLDVDEGLKHSAVAIEREREREEREREREGGREREMGDG